MNGRLPERKLAEDDGNACRHCLKLIPEGAGCSSWRIAPSRAAALCRGRADLPVAEPCEAGGGFARDAGRADYIVRGYGVDDRIVYGTRGVVATAAIPARAAELFADAGCELCRVRSSTNNCFQCRVER